MKNCKKRNASFYSRIFGIALVTMLTATTLWAKPKNAVEYTPFKSENPNATVFECEYIEDYPGELHFYCSFSDEYNGNKLVDCSSIAIYGWKKKKGGWEKLWEHQPKENHFNVSVLDKGNYKYTHYAVEVEVPENSMTLSVEGKHRYNEWDLMNIILQVSKDYKKLFYEKQDAERAEKERLAAEEKSKKEAKLNAARDAKGKEIAKGYIYHGFDEASRNAKLFAGGALQEGHAYYIPDFVSIMGGKMARVYFNDVPSTQLNIDYIDQKVKGDVASAGQQSTGYIIPVTVVVVGGKAPLYTPIVIGLIE